MGLKFQSIVASSSVCKLLGSFQGQGITIVEIFGLGLKRRARDLSLPSDPPASEAKVAEFQLHGSDLRSGIIWIRVETSREPCRACVGRNAWDSLCALEL